MKIICVKTGDVPQFYIKCETTQIRNNDPLYVPFFCEELCCEFAFAVKINRVTKSIGEQFAQRCWNEYSVVTNFWSEDLARRQRAFGAPMDIAYSFDRSFALENEFHLFGSDTIPAELFVNGELVETLMWSDISDKVNGVISYLSSYVTLKIGDVIMIKSEDRPHQIKMGDHVTIKLENEIIVETIIK